MVVDKRIFDLANKIMLALMWAGVWRGGKNFTVPIDADRASTVFAEAIFAAVTGEYPNWPKDYFNLTGSRGVKIYFDTAYQLLKRLESTLDPDFMAAVLYLFEPIEVGDIRDSGISTVFAERWGFTGWVYPDFSIGITCNVRWDILRESWKAYESLPENIKAVVNLVAPHIQPVLEMVSAGVATEIEKR